MIRLLFLPLTVLFCLPSSYGQLFKRLGNRVVDKIERKVEDKVVEEVSEEIANRAMRPIDDAIDAMFREQYKETYGKEYDDSEYKGDPEARAAAMQGIMSAMYGNVELPASYEFSNQISVEVYDYGSSKPNKMLLMIGKDGATMGFKNMDEKQLMVMDIDKDQFAIFNDENKTVMAMSGVFTMASAMAAYPSEEMPEKFKFEKTNKTKKILGYQAQQYKTESEEDKSEFYMTEDLPVDWSALYAKLLKKMAANFSYTQDGQGEEVPKGMLLEAKTVRKKDKKESKWIVTDISTSTTVITTSDYKKSFAR